MKTIIQNLIEMNKLIEVYTEKYGRHRHSVQLLVASKAQPLENIESILEAGQLILGENYLQEALPKIQALSTKKIEWHFIGPIQSNKTKKIAEHFAWVQSVAQEKIAQRLSDARPTSLPALNICIEINISHQSSKSGIQPDELLRFAKFCDRLPKLKLRGLMAIPAPTTHFDEQRKTFRHLFELWQSLRTEGFDIDTLSMGMSDDFEAAIAEGSTMVRIGSAIFGPRQDKKYP